MLPVFARSVVHIDGTDGSGTGFHYGGKWFVTCSHVVGATGKLLKNATIHGYGNLEIKMDSSFESCFFSSLSEEERVDVSEEILNKMDIAAFRLNCDLPALTENGAVDIFDVPKINEMETLTCYHWQELSKGIEKVTMPIYHIPEKPDKVTVRHQKPVLNI